jgi:hypothetical protein
VFQTQTLAFPLHNHYGYMFKIIYTTNTIVYRTCISLTYILWRVWRPSLLGNSKLNTPMHTRDSPTVWSDTLTTPVLLVTIATNNRTASIGRIATNSRKASVFYRAVRVLYSGQQQRSPVSLSLESESSSVSLRKQKGPVLAVNYRRQKPVFRRVAVVSGVRSLSLYLVVSWCVR